MTGDEEVKKVLKRAIDLIVVAAQSPEGGWRVRAARRPGPDISVTIMQVMALRGAKDSGMHVPDETLKKAIEYIKSCYDANSAATPTSRATGPPGFARTAAGVCVLQADRRVRQVNGDPGAVEYLKGNFEYPRQHYWYGHYYASHAMHQVGGKDWKDYYSLIKKEFLAMQQSNGHWPRGRDGQSPAPVYQTAIAVIALSVPADYLPDLPAVIGTVRFRKCRPGPNCGNRFRGGTPRELPPSWEPSTSGRPFPTRT